jgi:ParB/RepB/Spo0J family partition protein
MTRFLNVRIDQIVESRWQPREGIGDSGAFEDLVANVKVHGITNPLKAFVNKEGAYELITGHRRRRAAIKAGLTHVPVIVVATPKDEVGLRALREEVLFDNLLHEPLSPLEEAKAFKALREEEGYSIRQMAERLGKSKSYIGERLGLLDRPEDVQELVSARADTLRHAREISRVEDPRQRAELVEEAKAGASYQDIKARVDEMIPGRADTHQALTYKEPALSEPPEEEPSSEPIEGEELTEERLIPVNGNGRTTYVSVPSQPEELARRHVAPSAGGCTAAAIHCPHCGDGRGREVCNGCGHARWIIAFSSFEDYQRALAMVGSLIQR